MDAGMVRTTTVVGGVDTHSATHCAAVVDSNGALLGTAEFLATPAGYRQLLAWLRSYGDVAKVGVEGTGSYEARYARVLRDAGVAVVEVPHPVRRVRALRGKSNPNEAKAAARAAL